MKVLTPLTAAIVVVVVIAPQGRDVGKSVGVLGGGGGGGRGLVGIGVGSGVVEFESWWTALVALDCRLNDGIEACQCD